MTVRTVVVLILASLLVLFAAQNTQPVGLYLFFWQVTAPAAVAVFVAFACGVLVGAGLFWTEQHRTQRRQAKLPTPGTPAAPAKKKQSWWW
jgi:uncharacterized integral membrane protein